MGPRPGKGEGGNPCRSWPVSSSRSSWCVAPEWWTNARSSRAHSPSPAPVLQGGESWTGGGRTLSPGVLGVQISVCVDELNSVRELEAAAQFVSATVHVSIELNAGANRLIGT